MKTTRKIFAIANEIKNDWVNISAHALPYLDAMQSITNITDRYYADSAISIVRYFLANAQTWRGEVAKKIKIELKEMAKY